MGVAEILVLSLFAGIAAMLSYLKGHYDGWRAAQHDSREDG